MGAVKKSKIIRIPLEAYEKEKLRVMDMQNRIRTLTNEPVRIRFADYLRLRASKPIFIYDDELLNFFKKKKQTRRFNLI